MPPVCCRCNASGRCRNCACQKANRQCSNSHPCRLGHCENQPSSATERGTVSHQTPKELNESTEAPTASPEITTQVLDAAVHGTQEIFATPTSISNPASVSIPTIKLVTETPAINSLSSFSPSSDPVFYWGEVDGETFGSILNDIYDEIVHRRRNLFKVSSGKAGTAFVRELSRLFRAYADH